MKLKKLIRDLCCASKVIVQFGREHHATISMMQGIYGKQSLHNDRIAGSDTILSITSCGSFYKSHVLTTSAIYLRTKKRGLLLTDGILTGI